MPKAAPFGVPVAERLTLPFSSVPEGYGGIPQRWLYGTRPHGGQASDPWRRGAGRCSLQYPFSLDGPIDGGTGHSEKVSQIGGRVLAGVQ